MDKISPSHYTYQDDPDAVDHKVAEILQEIASDDAARRSFFCDRRGYIQAFFEKTGEEITQSNTNLRQKVTNLLCSDVTKLNFDTTIEFSNIPQDRIRKGRLELDTKNSSASFHQAHGQTFKQSETPEITGEVYFQERKKGEVLDLEIKMKQCKGGTLTIVIYALLLNSRHDMDLEIYHRDDVLIIGPDQEVVLESKDEHYEDKTVKLTSFLNVNVNQKTNRSTAELYLKLREE